MGPRSCGWTPTQFTRNEDRNKDRRLCTNNVCREFTNPIWRERFCNKDGNDDWRAKKPKSRWYSRRGKGMLLQIGAGLGLEPKTLYRKASIQPSLLRGSLLVNSFVIGSELISVPIGTAPAKSEYCIFTWILRDPERRKYPQGTCCLPICRKK